MKKQAIQCELWDIDHLLRNRELCFNVSMLKRIKELATTARTVKKMGEDAEVLGEIEGCETSGHNQLLPSQEMAGGFESFLTQGGVSGKKVLKTIASMTSAETVHRTVCNVLTNAMGQVPFVGAIFHGIQAGRAIKDCASFKYASFNAHAKINAGDVRDALIEGFRLQADTAAFGAAAKAAKELAGMGAALVPVPGVQQAVGFVTGFAGLMAKLYRLYIDYCEMEYANYFLDELRDTPTCDFETVIDCLNSSPVLACLVIVEYPGQLPDLIADFEGENLGSPATKEEWLRTFVSNHPMWGHNPAGHLRDWLADRRIGKDLGIIQTADKALRKATRLWWKAPEDSSSSSSSESSSYSSSAYSDSD